MGRKRVIDRDQLLEAAYRVISGQGATGLSFDAIAKEAGVSKGGVVYAFSSKEELIEAMLSKAQAAYSAAIETVIGDPRAHLVDKARAHVDATAAEDLANATRVIALLAALANAPGYQQRLKDWYLQIFDIHQLSGETDRRARLAMFAAEGAFMMRGYGLVTFDEQQWLDFFNDIHQLLLRVN
jgi:AcrR family transcriptional regulator